MKQQAVRKTALITGASAGFGYEFAKLFAQDGYNLVLTALHGEKLTRVAKKLSKQYGVGVVCTELDLSLPGAASKLHKWVSKQNISVDFLVNNAGIGLYGRFTDHTLAQEQGLIQLNVNALAELCHLFIPDMVKAGGGKILNVASIAAFQAGPYYASYFASKAFVLLLSEALYYEYAPDNVTVTAVCPGVSRTGFFKRAGMREDSRMLQGYFMEAPDVAAAGYRAMMKGKRIVIPGNRNRFVALGYRLFPRGVINRITRQLVSSSAE